MRFLQTTNYKLRTPARGRAGYTVIELLLVLGIIAILATVSLISLVRQRGTAEVTTSAERIVALLREAQSRSVSQASSTSWGVHLENGTAPFYALYSGTYSTSSRESYSALPTTVDFTTSTIAADRYIEISFSQLSGIVTGSTTIGLFAVRTPTTSSTITVATSGTISY